MNALVKAYEGTLDANEKGIDLLVGLNSSLNEKIDEKIVSDFLFLLGAKAEINTIKEKNKNLKLILLKEDHKSDVKKEKRKSWRNGFLGGSLIALNIALFVQ